MTWEAQRARLRFPRPVWILAACVSLGVQPGSASQAPFDTGTDVRVNHPSSESLPPNCVAQSEVSLAAHGNRVVSGWNDMSVECLEARLGLPGASSNGVGYSPDAGSSWPPDGDRLLEPMVIGGRAGWLRGDPALAAGPNGTFYYAAMGEDLTDLVSPRSLIAVARSDDGIEWSSPVEASHRPTGALQDKPWIAVDSSANASTRGNVYVVWTEFGDPSDPEGRPTTGRLFFSRSVDGGKTFTSRQFTGGTTGATGQVAVGPDGEVYVTWTGQTNNVLGVARSTDGGVTFKAKGQVTAFEEFGTENRACLPEGVGRVVRVLGGDIRVHPFPSLAVDTSGSDDPNAEDYNEYRGRIYVASATQPDPDEPDPNDDGSPDIALIYSDDGGETWVGGTQTRVTRFINDVRDNDQWHPQVAVDGRGIVAVTWYDRRLSATNWDIDVFATFSTDGGQTFAPAFRVTDLSFPPALNNPNSSLLGGCYMGDYNGLVATGPGRFLAAWGDNRNSVVDQDLPDSRAKLPDPDVYADTIRVSVPESD